MQSRRVDKIPIFKRAMRPHPCIPTSSLLICPIQILTNFVKPGNIFWNCRCTMTVDTPLSFSKLWKTKAAIVNFRRNRQKVDWRHSTRGLSLVASAAYAYAPTPHQRTPYWNKLDFWDCFVTSLVILPAVYFTQFQLVQVTLLEMSFFIHYSYRSNFNRLSFFLYDVC